MATKEQAMVSPESIEVELRLSSGDAVGTTFRSMAYGKADASFGRTGRHATAKASGVSPVPITMFIVPIGFLLSSILERLSREDSEWLPEMEYFGEDQVNYRICDIPAVRQTSKLTDRGIFTRECLYHVN